jgi:UDP-N-acetylglucosamine 2-epimerase (non-hydrolysing)
LRVTLVVGARPNFGKVAPIVAALRAFPEMRPAVVHTGQHYDPELSAVFSEDLALPEPARMLHVGSGSHAVQTARVMTEFEAYCLEARPLVVVVVGDVNSTMACAIVCAKLGIAVAHVEAGLRSFDRTMPEEINRLVTDALADRLYTHCREADENLRREGVPESRVRFVGNVMIDSLLKLRGRAEALAAAAALGLESRRFGVVTLHRPALVDLPDRLAPMLESLAEVSRDLPLLYPVHPRSLSRLRDFGLLPPSAATPGEGAVVTLPASRLHLLPPLRYLEFLWAMDHARLVITDSGGVQEETAVLGVPCITVREHTERAVTIEQGTNRLVGISPGAVLEAARDELAGRVPRTFRTPELWDGRAGERIAADLAAWIPDLAGRC